MKWVAAIAVIPVLGAALLVLSVATIFSTPLEINGEGCPSPSAYGSSSSSTSSVDQPNAQQQAAGSASQKQILDQIIGQVKAYRLPLQVAIDAVTAGLAESGLDNHEAGNGQAVVTNLDSVGVFQERPSQGWGTPQQILNVGYATDKWLQDLLSSVPSWQSMPPQAVAQAVERSAYPQRYAQFVGQATTWVEQDWSAIPAATPAIPPPRSPTTQGSSPSPAGPNGSSGSGTCAQARSTASAITSTLTAEAEGGFWPVKLPVPPPGWQQQIQLPTWPASELAKPPTEVSNQCVAGAEWAFDAMHQSSYHFPSANGVDVARAAVANGLIASSVPLVGDVVSFTIPGSSAGHVALVIATSLNAFEVVEQNWLQDNGYVGAWDPTDWDLRSVAWPNRSVVGFAGVSSAA